MLDVMYEIPSRKTAREVVISEEVILKKSEPVILYASEKDEAKKRELTAQREDYRRVLAEARARGLERIGRLAEARAAWLEASRLGPEPRRKRSLTEAERLAGALARGPYLGLTFAGETTV